MTIDRQCLDAETVAAWMDGGLDAAGVAAAEAHASTCERCQALLATVVRTLPADQQSAVVSGFSRIDKRQSVWKWWFAPLAATAAAVTIWMVVPQTPIQRPPASESAREMADALKKAQAPAAPAEATAQAQPPASLPPPEDLANSRRNVPAAENEAKNKLADARADTAKEDAIGRKDAAGFAPDQASALQREQSASAREQSGELQRDKQGKREENAARAAEMRQVVEAPAPAPATAAERMREEPAAPAPSREQAGARDQASIGAVRQLQKQVSTPTVVSPDPNSRWRALAGGTIERSEDGGRTWIAVRVAPTEDVLAGASPGRLVAWMVGRGGLVLLATDGTNFTRLPFPQSVDLVAVSSPEPRIAIVTTADGRTFRTEDAGRNWRQ